MKSGIHTNPSLRILRPILNKWIGLNSALGDQWGEVGDAPWWYNERASVSILAGAVWKTGGYAFEEYGSVKKGEDRVLSGRLDLMFSISEVEFIAEAKQCWPAAMDKEQCIDCVSDSIERAKQDVRRCASSGMRRLAVVFGVPFLPKTASGELPDSLDRFISFAKERKAHAIAWVFPNLERVPTVNGKNYPGIVVWINEVKR